MRRFIAGAVCPQCRAMDRIVVEEVEAASGTDVDEPAGVIRRRHCVSCGYTDTLTTGAAAEPATRVTRPAARDVPATSVRILAPHETGRKKTDS